mgnify:CR=1 FL=1
MINITPEQNKLLGQLLTAGVPLPIALPIALDPQAAQAGLTDGVALFEQGANKLLDVIPSLVTPKKRSRSARASDKMLSRAFKEANSKLRNKNGSLRRGKTQADVARMAQRLRKKMGTTKGQVRKTARRAFEK